VRFSVVERDVSQLVEERAAADAQNARGQRAIAARLCNALMWPLREKSIVTNCNTKRLGDVCAFAPQSFAVNDVRRTQAVTAARSGAASARAR
jgi:hypothetical protein